MRFLIDECLHESVVQVAHEAGFGATHVNHLGLNGKPDWVLLERSVQDGFTFVTNNRMDFIRLFSKKDLHPGLIVLIPNVVPRMQRALFQAALWYSTGKDLINRVIELDLDSETVRCSEYQLPR